MNGLRKLHVLVHGSTVGDLFESEIKTDVEIKLRKTELSIDGNAPAHLDVAIVMADVDPDGTSHISGEYGMAMLTLYDNVCRRGVETGGKAIVGRRCS